MNDFVEVYIFSQHKNEVFSELIFLLVIGCVVFLLGAYFLRKAKHEKRKFIKFFEAVFLLIWGTVWIGMNGMLLYSSSKEYSEIKSIYDNLRYSVAEGEVEVIHEQPSSGHDKGDVIIVDGTEFEFSYYRESFGYHQTISNGGILKSGVYTRLSYFEDVSANETTNVIIRVEMRD